MLKTRLGVARALVFGLGAWLLSTAPALSEITTVPGADAPIVRIQALQGNVTIRTWDRPDVQIDGDPSTYTLDQHVSKIPANFPPTPISPGRIVGPEGLIELPAESFVVSTLPPGSHNTIVLKGGFVGTLSIMVPSATPVLSAQIGLGSLNVDGYHNGTLIAHMRAGSVTLRDMSGDAFVQDLRGTMQISDSSFGRLRARGALGPMIFERCNVRQIEASNVDGSIVYDRGTFEPGLARFASDRGDVAVGVASGNAQLGGSVSSSGRVYTMFDGRAQVDAHDVRTSAAVGSGGGATVNATSGSGNVYLYDGSLWSRTRLAPEWQTPFGTLSGANTRGFNAGGFGGQSRYGTVPHYPTNPGYDSGPRQYLTQPRPYSQPYGTAPRPYGSVPHPYGSAHPYSSHPYSSSQGRPSHPPSGSHPSHPSSH